MTPLLRAGLGGLAAALRVIHLQERPHAGWPPPEIAAGSGAAIVEKDHVGLRWPKGGVDKVLEALFVETFRLAKFQRISLMDLVGTYEMGRPPAPAVAVALQSALKRTFLQNGKSTPKDGKPQTITIELDDR